MGSWAFRGPQISSPPDGLSMTHGSGGLLGGSWVVTRVPLRGSVRIL